MHKKTKSSSESICKCKDAIKPQLIAAAGCSDDLAAVSALPDQWVPRHSGSVLTNYLKQCEVNYERLLKDMLEDAKQVNVNIDADIRALSEILLSHIYQNQKEIDCIIEKYRPVQNELTVEARNEAFRELTKLFTQRMQDLAKFKHEALGLERRRAEGIKNVLKSKFHHLIDVGYKCPKELLHNFDERIYEINQQLLSNSRAYIELEGKLRVQLDESAVHARSAVNQLCIKEPARIPRVQSALPWFQKDHLHMRSNSADGRKRHTSNNSEFEPLFDIEKFKDCVSQLVEAYRSAIFKIYTGFSGQLENLYKDIGFKNFDYGKSTTSVAAAHDLEHMIERALRQISGNSIPMSSSAYKNLGDKARSDVLNMQISVSSLGKCLHETYVILYEASHLWDEHILRTAFVQKLTAAAIEDMQTAIHDSIELANEINFNITLEQLRCAPDTDKLQQNFDISKNLLDRISEMYLQHSEAEIAKLEEYMNLAPIMINVLLSECNCFLENHPKSVIQPTGSLSSSVGTSSPTNKSTYFLLAPIPRAILQTQIQEVSLNNWKNGFIDAFIYNLPVVSEELNHQARKWVDVKSLQLNMRYSLKFMSHSIRTERLIAAREARLCELRFHDLRLSSHLEAIFDLIDSLPLEASSFLAIDSPELYPFCNWITSIQIDIDNLLSRDPLDPEVKRLKMCSYAPRLLRHREHFEESLDAALEQYKKKIEYRVQEARISNMRFMSQLKLFIDGGKYSAAEATKTCATLVKAADALEPCFNKTMDAVNYRRSQLLALADQLLIPVQRIVEESFKMGGKGELDKKKANKKK